MVPKNELRKSLRGLEENEIEDVSLYYKDGHSYCFHGMSIWDVDIDLELDFLFMFINLRGNRHVIIYTDNIGRQGGNSLVS